MFLGHPQKQFWRRIKINGPEKKIKKKNLHFKFRRNTKGQLLQGPPIRAMLKAV